MENLSNLFITVFILITTNSEDVSLNPYFDKLIVAVIGISSALLTDFITKRIREKKLNKKIGLNTLEVEYINKLKNFNISSDFIFPPNPDFDSFLSKKGYSKRKIQEALTESYITHLEAKDKLSFIRTIVETNS